MEVNNQMMDQLLVNTAQQAPANPNAQKAKDTDGPNFDSMVNQRRATQRPSARDIKIANGAKPERTEKAEEAEAAQETELITDEQYALAAAMLMQTQAQTISPELVAVENTVTVETVLAVDAGEQDETAETPLAVPAQDAAELPVAAAESETRIETPETAEARKELDVPTQRQTEAAPEAHTERPVAEAKPQETEAPEQKADEPQLQQQRQTVREEAPRAENVSEQPHFVRNEAAKPQTQDETATDDTQAAQAAPLFQNVEATVVKVAEAPRPIPLEAEDGVEQLGAKINDVVVNHADLNRVEVTLTPENLGKLTVEITRGENGNLSIVLHTTTERAANLLERHTANLQHALSANRGGDVEVQVRPSEESERQFLNPDGRNDQNRQQQQQQNRRQDKASAQDFLQQLRLGLVDNGSDQ